MKRPAFYWLLVATLVATEVLLVKRMVLASTWDARIPFLVVALLLLEAWSVFERNRQSAPIVYKVMFTLMMVGIALGVVVAVVPIRHTCGW